MTCAVERRLSIASRLKVSLPIGFCELLVMSSSSAVRSIMLPDINTSPVTGCSRAELPGIPVVSGLVVGSHFTKCPT